ncbi:hypothetical protein F503_01887 [Ophiostoma piceae UAMH 11346]|uniref:Uncharacterized protein n=1 Tax=Ophiostoma piceae (strain UAMH 11346) TaxID=1262450 RepID=S3BQL6_OPHP1|nr:hypothetical protein F503_01887 [Ophiostoma piceae UAMH 11346]
MCRLDVQELDWKCGHKTYLFWDEIRLCVDALLNDSVCSQVERRVVWTDKVTIECLQCIGEPESSSDNDSDWSHITHDRSYHEETVDLIDWSNLDWLTEDAPEMMGGATPTITGASSAQDMVRAVTASLSQSEAIYQANLDITRAPLKSTSISTEAPDSFDAQAGGTRTETECLLSTANTSDTNLTNSEINHLLGRSLQDAEGSTLAIIDDIINSVDIAQLYRSSLADIMALKDDATLSSSSLGSVDIKSAGVVPAAADQVATDASEEIQIEDAQGDETDVDAECLESTDGIADDAEAEAESVESAHQDRHSAMDESSDIVDDWEWEDDEMDTSEAAEDVVPRDEFSVMLKTPDLLIMLKSGGFHVRFGSQKAPRSSRVHKPRKNHHKVAGSGHKGSQKRSFHFHFGFKSHTDKMCHKVLGIMKYTCCGMESEHCGGIVPCADALRPGAGGRLCSPIGSQIAKTEYMTTPCFKCNIKRLFYS